MVDDGSPDIMMRHAHVADDSRISYVRLLENSGPGVARNVGVRYAVTRGAAIVAFQDDDDLAHPDRVRHTRAIFGRSTDVDFIYSSFVPINNTNEEIPRELIRGDMREVLEEVEARAPTGPRAWIEIAARTGFVATTSTVAVRSHLAINCPFPPLRVSEDSHTWLCMSASGAVFCFAPDIPTYYRMVDCETQSNQRSSEFLHSKCLNDSLGLAAAVRIALREGDISRIAAAEVARLFCLRLAQSIERQGLSLLANQVREDDFVRRVCSLVPISV